MTAGTQIGTTITGLIAALANAGAGLKNFQLSLQIALVHVLFNVIGLMLWGIVPFMRKVPLSIAVFGGIRAEKYRWWGVVYLVTMFLVIPVGVFGISLASPLAASIIIAVVVFAAIVVAVINQIRRCKPGILPEFLKSWKWLPIWCRSLEPYDRNICNAKLCCEKKVYPDQEQKDQSEPPARNTSESHV